MQISRKGAIALVGFLIAVTAAPASAKEITFRNDTCADLSLEGSADNACFGTGACTLELPAYGTKHVRLREGYSPKWAQISVVGTCEEQEYSVAGICAIDLEDALRDKGFNTSVAPTIGPSGQRPIFEDVLGSLDQGSDFATVTISTSLCESGAGLGDSDVCAPRCTVD